MRVFEKEPLHTPIADEIDFRVIRRIEIEQREALNLRLSIERVALDQGMKANLDQLLQIGVT
jgi:hypothetical protein